MCVIYLEKDLHNKITAEILLEILFTTCKYATYEWNLMSLALSFPSLAHKLAY